MRMVSGDIYPFAMQCIVDTLNMVFRDNDDKSKTFWSSTLPTMLVHKYPMVRTTIKDDFCGGY